MFFQVGQSHGACEVYGPPACRPPKQKFSIVHFCWMNSCQSFLVATFNMLLKLSEHSGKASRQTAAAIFQEMLHVGIG